MKRAVMIAGLAVLLVPCEARAQMQWTDQGFVNLNFGVQGGSHALNTETTFELYEEPAAIASGQQVQGGLFFDIAAGYLVWRNLTAGVAYSRMSSDTDGGISGSIPDLAVHDRPRPVTGSFSDASHTQHAIHLQGVWMVPVTDKVDVGVAFGPTIFIVSQDVPTAVSVTEPGPSISSVTVTTEDSTTVGFSTGIDVTYLLRPQLGVGGILRFSWGSADVPGASDNLTVGGVQLGAGVRYRF